MFKALPIIVKYKTQFLKRKSGYFFLGPLGHSLGIPYNKNIKIKLKGNKLYLLSKTLAFFNLYKKLLFQKLRGVCYGFKTKLKLNGVGYVAEKLKKKLILKLGFCKNVIILIPKSIKIKVKKRKLLKILGRDLNEITQFGAKIRRYKVPEVYKGKGILYFKEKLFLKVGKKN